MKLRVHGTLGARLIGWVHRRPKPVRRMWPGAELLSVIVPFTMFRERAFRLARIGSAVAIALAAAMIVAAAHDGTLWLPGPSVGLLEHRAYLLLMPLTPLLIMTLASLVVAAEMIASDPAEFTESYIATTNLTDRLSFRKWGPRKRTFLRLLMLMGFFSFVVNTMNASRPLMVYGADIFDSAVHPVSFYIARVYVMLLWCGLFPFAVAAILSVAAGLISLIKFAHTQETLNVRWFAPDNCGGMSRLGALAMRVTAALLLLAAWPIANYYTIGNRRLFLMSIFFLAGISVGVVFSVLATLHRAVRHRRDADLGAISERLARAYDAQEWAAAASLVTIREGILSINTWACRFGTPL